MVTLAVPVDPPGPIVSYVNPAFSATYRLRAGRDHRPVHPAAARPQHRHGHGGTDVRRHAGPEADSRRAAVLQQDRSGVLARHQRGAGARRPRPGDALRHRRARPHRHQEAAARAQHHGQHRRAHRLEQPAQVSRGWPGPSSPAPAATGANWRR
ncbi:MAG: hypothetical protein MZW92_38650 [Comamonadaceae bacterium]|nr:hypothetical protein [Comamonadaceae bacterium]